MTRPSLKALLQWSCISVWQQHLQLRRGLPRPSGKLHLGGNLPRPRVGLVLGQLQHGAATGRYHQLLLLAIVDERLDLVRKLLGKNKGEVGSH